MKNKNEGSKSDNKSEGAKPRPRCRHHGCGCVVDVPGAFCSEHCRRAVLEGWAEEGCSCGHPVCVTTVARTSPKDVLETTTLTRAQKIERLRQMAYDERELQVASEEGMAGPGPSSLDAIQEALRQLGAEEEGTDAKQ